MTLTWESLVLLASLACFVAAAAGAAFGRVNLIAAGLALWVLVPTIHNLAG